MIARVPGASSSDFVHLREEQDIPKDQLVGLPIDLTSSFETMNDQLGIAGGAIALTGLGLSIASCSIGGSMWGIWAVAVFGCGGIIGVGSLQDQNPPPPYENFSDQAEKLDALVAAINTSEVPENVNCILPKGKVYLKEDQIQSSMLKCHKYALTSILFYNRLMIFFEDRLSSLQKEQVHDEKKARDFIRNHVFRKMNSSHFLQV
ncbi:MAG: hypothetical protein Q8L98_02660 [Chlamydiales bacterium]|nr:hypothetical protein [Chlamydiales bacterium]